ncbi:MAG: alkaline phosphatase family protein [Kiritimatiellae bacterium]|nr:alkaline phosphatase family protein [Kiritimatiellia bacterium]MDD4736077.1 alkaline phosphatase family protein [Kiritimatiellia bacterium]
MKDKLLVVQIAALGADLLRQAGINALNGMPFHPAKSVFPALTSPFQASLRTALSPESHGLLLNGFFNRATRKPAFWEQSASLISLPRIWENVRAQNRTVALLFWQQSLGESADFILSPAPIHKHHGGMIQDCYSKPDGLYPQLTQALKRPFNLMHYWGPLASHKTGDWIAEATAEVIANPAYAPDLCLTYLPTLDYDLQRHGPSSKQARRALTHLFQQLELITHAAETNGYRLLLLGDYAIGEVTIGPLFPNRILLENNLLKTRRIRGRLYPDLYDSPAFVLADHEVGQVFVRNPSNLPRVLELLSALDGVESVHPFTLRQTSTEPPDTAPDALLLAKPGAWIAYPWWTDPHEAPDYARHVDIHSKPGYDPCELFWGWPPGSISLDPYRIKGSHGRADRPIAWASNALDTIPTDTIELAEDLAYLLRTS